MTTNGPLAPSNYVDPTQRPLARVAHAVVYLLGVPYLRTIVFTAGFVCVAGIFWEVIKGTVGM